MMMIILFFLIISNVHVHPQVKVHFVILISMLVPTTSWFDQLGVGAKVKGYQRTSTLITNRVMNLLNVIVCK